MPSVMGEEVTAENLEAVLQRCAANLPGDFKPDSQSWGLGAATNLFAEIRGTPLHDQAMAIVRKFAQSGDADYRELARLFALG